MIIPYHCEGAASRPAPSLAIGEISLGDGGDARSFALTTPPAQCNNAQPATLASQVSLQVTQDGTVVFRQNVPLSPRPQPR